MLAVEGQGSQSEGSSDGSLSSMFALFYTIGFFFCHLLILKSLTDMYV